MKINAYSFNSGYTLLEVMITLALIAGLSLIAISSLSHFKELNEQQVLIDEIKTAVEFAKIQAVSFGNSVILSPKNNTNLNWSNGMILTLINGRLKKTELINQWEWNHLHWNVAWYGASSSNQITFSNNPVKAISNGKFVLTNQRTNKHVELILNRIGRIRVKRD